LASTATLLESKLSPGPANDPSGIALEPAGDAWKGSHMARMVSFLVLGAILVVITIYFFRVMAGFFVPLFLAALVGVMVEPLHRWIVIRCRGFRYIAATCTTLIVLLIGLLPIGFVVTTATLEGMTLIDRLQLGDVRKKLDELRHTLGLQFPHEMDVRRIEASLHFWRDQQRVGESLDFRADAVQNLLDRLNRIDAWVKAQGDRAPLVDVDGLREQLERLRDSPPESAERDEALFQADARFREFKRGLLGGTYRAWLVETIHPTDAQLEQLRRNLMSTAGPALLLGGDAVALAGRLVFGTVILIAALFFLLAEGPRMLDALVRISLLEERYVRELVMEFDRACRAIVLATLLSAIAQGLLAGMGFYAVGLRGSVALLVVFTMVLAIIPFVGAIAVWLPVALYLYFYEGQLAGAIGLAVYGTVIVSQADNVIKPYILHGQSNLHPLLALLSVIGGVQTLGPIGILVGPMVVVFLQVLLRLMQRELSSLDRAPWQFWQGLATGREPRAATSVEAADAGEARAEGSPPASPADSTAAGGNSVAAAPENGNLKTNAPPPRQPQRSGKRKKR
jgi:predicted PurR-regulated permease PerM